MRNHLTPSYALWGFVFLALTNVNAHAQGTWDLRMEVYEIPAAARSEIGEVSDELLRAALVDKKAILLHRGRIKVDSGTRSVYEDGSKVTVMSGWDRNERGQILPTTEATFVGLSAEFEVYLQRDKSLVTIPYSVEHTKTPHALLRSSVTLKEDDATKDFSYDIPALPNFKAVGSFVGPIEGTRVLFETVDSKTAVVVLLRYSLDSDKKAEQGQSR